jgi:hypothetical protein
MQMAEQSRIAGLFWYFRFDGNFCLNSTEIICDDIIKNDFDSCARVFFFPKVRSFVLILKYNCFTHGLQMPEVRLFF